MQICGITSTWHAVDGWRAAGSGVTASWRRLKLWASGRFHCRRVDSGPERDRRIASGERRRPRHTFCYICSEPAGGAVSGARCSTSGRLTTRDSPAGRRPEEEHWAKRVGDSRPRPQDRTAPASKRSVAECGSPFCHGREPSRQQHQQPGGELRPSCRQLSNLPLGVVEVSGIADDEASARTINSVLWRADCRMRVLGGGRSVRLLAPVPLFCIGRVVHWKKKSDEGSKLVARSALARHPGKAACSSFRLATRCLD